MNETNTTIVDQGVQLVGHWFFSHPFIFVTLLIILVFVFNMIFSYMGDLGETQYQGFLLSWTITFISGLLYFAFFYGLHTGEITLKTMFGG